MITPSLLIEGIDSGRPNNSCKRKEFNEKTPHWHNMLWLNEPFCYQERGLKMGDKNGQWAWEIEQIKWPALVQKRPQALFHCLVSNLWLFSLPLAIYIYSVTWCPKFAYYTITTFAWSLHMVPVGTYNEPVSRVSFAPQTHLLELLVLWDLSVDNPQLSHFHDKAFGWDFCSY